MSAQPGDYLASSPIAWFIDHANEVVDSIATESEITSDMFRRDQVDDATLHDKVPTAVQRLIRWTDECPDDVFHFGFKPKIFPRQDDDSFQLPPEACNLKQYVAANTPSIFVSTSQPYRTATGPLEVLTCGTGVSRIEIGIVSSTMSMATEV